MAITKEMKRVLDTLIPASPDLQERFFTIQHAIRQTNTPYTDFLRILEQLSEDDLVQYGDRQKSCFFLTEHGVKYKEIKSMGTLEKWRERLWGFLTGVISVLLAWWLTTL